MRNPRPTPRTTTPRTQTERREATTEALLTAARHLFSHQGYAQTSTEQIVQASGVTRGALYHHYKNKEALFLAVLENVMQEVAERIDTATQTSSDPRTQLHLGCRTFLETALEPDVRQIVLIDAPAVVGWQTWRDLDARYVMKTLSAGLQALKVTLLDATTHLLSGGMNEAALWIANHPHPIDALEEADAALSRLLQAVT